MKKGNEKFAFEHYRNLDMRLEIIVAILSLI